MNTSDPFSKPDLLANAITRRRYQHLAPFYDSMEALTERRFSDWRRRLWSLVKGNYVLEVGIGTGKNMPFYPTGVFITGIDLTPGMLDHARTRLRRTDLQDWVTLQLGDAQALNFPDASFDMAVATFVFCSVPDPVLGLREMKRVVKPGGCILLLEHMRSPNPFLGFLMDMLNPLVVRMMGANINRRTVENIQKAGLELERVEDLGMGGVFKLIVTHGPTKGE
ncbi:MAG: hypothetical protein A2X25_11855 [Chloroflexi bacterium GWB2_49_20]|nr:MAG: hypothetical protein A2X25_11855 [Chloroflexi bacterium GWB2_49_20]OGN77698.1 MAG: hypothetical protein A2X26_10125 [Chloroflexi bacterium GWC2_49_37]OGN86473.1 MAG: hypothetical protein A2X27_06280 [Chloroflexi bacterium GWD2_49_16]HBG74720.1 SAM-dependent methyltransferase [Anaerolineae bacterium]